MGGERNEETKGKGAECKVVSTRIVVDMYEVDMNAISIKKRITNIRRGANG